MEILIPPMFDEDMSDQVRGLLAGLEGAGLLKMSVCILATTEDEQVAGLITRYGRRLDTAPVVVPVENKSRKGIGGRRKKVQEPVQEPVVEPVAISPEPEPMPEPTPASTPVVKTKKAGRPRKEVSQALMTDLRKIVAEAGMKALNGNGGGHAPDASGGEHPGVEGATVYTNPVTGEAITYGDMMERLRTRRVNAKERFISNRHGLVEVYDKGPGKKLVLHRVNK